MRADRPCRQPGRGGGAERLGTSESHTTRPPANHNAKEVRMNFRLKQRRPSRIDRYRVRRTYRRSRFNL